MISFTILLSCGPQLPPAPEGDSAQVRLDDALIEVRWDDGDTFSWYDASGEKQKARLKGFNTLESYGPVHRWGDWTAAELYAIAKAAGGVAGAAVWSCTDTQEGGGYGRRLVDCPGLRHHMLATGYAHAFSIDAAAPSDDLKHQALAIRKGRGMWEKGAPEGLLTSLHSADERGDGSAYNRLCSLTTGLCDKAPHAATYSTCQEVCEQGSCMLYVAYKQRYGEARADCLR
jgi:endonuclease YncB( thermonuclease family)